MPKIISIIVFVFWKLNMSTLTSTCVMRTDGFPEPLDDVRAAPSAVPAGHGGSAGGREHARACAAVARASAGIVLRELPRGDVGGAASCS